MIDKGKARPLERLKCEIELNDWFQDKTQSAQLNLIMSSILAIQQDIRTLMANQQILEQQVADLGTSFGLIEAFLTSLESQLIAANERITDLSEDVAENQVDLTPLIAKVTEVKNFAAGLNPESPTPPAEENPDPEVPPATPEPTPTPDPEAPAEEPAPEPAPEPEEPGQVAPENPAPAPAPDEDSSNEAPFPNAGAGA